MDTCKARPLDLRVPKHDPLRYLLAPRRPAWARYRTLVDICGRPQDDPDVIACRRARDASAIVRKLRARQQPDGSFRCMPWLHIHRYFFHQFIEMGYGIDDPDVRKTAEMLLNYQLPAGAYRHPHARMVEPSKSSDNWAPCMTGYITKALMNLGFTDDPRVQASLAVMLAGQRQNGGWICEHVGRRAPYCIYGGTPWAFTCLAHAGLISKESVIAKRAIGVFTAHKDKIIRHGYHRDHCYRCDEPLLLPALFAIGLTHRHSLVSDLYASLVEKQQPNGSWLFKHKSSAPHPSPWYTIECVLALCRPQQRCSI